MREILFRAKRLDNGEWVEGFYTEFNPNIANETPVIEDMREDYRVDKETVGQYTGLTDKNGKKIFEGDIIDASNEWWDAAGPAGHSSPIIKVEWIDWACGFAPFADYDCDCGVHIDASGCEVMGNVYDNPELMLRMEERNNN